MFSRNTSAEREYSNAPRRVRTIEVRRDDFSSPKSREEEISLLFRGIVSTRLACIPSEFDTVSLLTQRGFWRFYVYVGYELYSGILRESREIFRLSLRIVHEQNGVMLNEYIHRTRELVWSRKSKHQNENEINERWIFLDNSDPSGALNVNIQRIHSTRSVNAHGRSMNVATYYIHMYIMCHDRKNFAHNVRSNGLVTHCSKESDTCVNWWKFNT